ncbi:kinesin-like protein KIF18A isoform X2 [Actinia tenebrosa]|uniref:Kinesin-like protein n=1 Tax=Actinia tenebrosa TaxID=6105 RepID=A0A6P8I0Y0_ACTTE|nr:kinesin-like protein KIF18A isoform X2 [Actinia tenebrosa]
MVSSSRNPTSLKAKGGEKHNEQSSNMKVVIRVRPLNELENTEANGSVIRVMDQNVLVFDPNEDCEAMNFPGSFKEKRRSLLQRRRRDLRFIFDRVFNENSTTTEVFEHTTKNIIDGVLNGYNCTVFAYGATGAGKTHTMLGNTETPGVVFLTMMDLYQRIEELKDEKTCDVAVSYLEVYNETIRDLLLPGPPLAVREDPARGVCVSGLTLHKPRTAQELLGMLEFGNNNRTQHPTDANAQSSRSHAVFQVFVRQKDRTAGLQANVRLAKMSLIDLAGSERAHVSTNRGARFREGANINKSLLALGNCINALADKENKAGHIPYRNSKLTRLLKDSLGGNCRTVMIAAISPSRLSYEDTYNTLKYADRAKSIKVKLSKNVVSVDWHVSRYAKIVDELRTEIIELKDKLSRYEEAGMATKTPLKNDKRLQMDSLKTTFQSIMSERAMIKRDMVDIEAAQRDLLIKAYRKERNLERIQLLCLDGEQRETAVKTQKKKLETRIMEAKQKLKQNTESLDQVIAEMKGVAETSKELEEDFLRCQASSKMELECAELRRQCRYFKKFTHAQEKDAQNTERILAKVLTAFKNQFFLIKGAGLATREIDNEYDSIVKLVTGGREVSWADVSENDNLDLSALHSITNDATLIETTKFDTPTTTIFTTLHKKSNLKPMTPRNISRAVVTPINPVANSNQNSPEIDDPRVSLNQAFEAATTRTTTTPLLPQRGNMNEKAMMGENARSTSVKSLLLTPLRGQGDRPSSATPICDMHGSVTGNATTEGAKKHTTKIKAAWMDLPNRTHSSTSIVGSSSGELSISAFLTASNTPKRVPTTDIMTPLREISVNNRNTTQQNNHSGVPSSLETPSKQAKLTEKAPHKYGGKPPTSMMPKRMASSKENLYPKTKTLRKATSTNNLNTNNSSKVQRHVNGLKRAISSSVLNRPRNFAPRSTPVNMQYTMI